MKNVIHTQLKPFLASQCPLDVLKKQIPGCKSRFKLRGIMVMTVMAVTVAMPLRLAKKIKIKNLHFGNPSFF